MATVKLNTRVEGVGPDLILLHGLFGAGDHLGGIRRRLAPNFRVHVPDLRNHGRSGHAASMSYPEMAADLAAYMEREGLERASFLGHSMGGKVAMELALSKPARVERLIVADIAPVDYPPHHEEVREALENLDPGAVASRREADRELARWIEQAGVRQFLLTNLVPDDENGFRWRFNLGGILGDYESIMAAPDARGPFAGPTLFLRGGASDYIKEDYREAVLTRFPAARLKVIPEAGHWLHVEQPDLFARLCERFLNEEQQEA